MPPGKETKPPLTSAPLCAWVPHWAVPELYQVASQCLCSAGRWVPRSSPVLHPLPSASKGLFRSARIKIEMSSTFFFVTPVKCFNSAEANLSLVLGFANSYGARGWASPCFNDK